MKITKSRAIGNIYKLDFKRRLKNTIIWASIMIVIGLVYYGVYPSMKDLVVDKLDSMPPEIINFISTSGELDMTDFNYYFAMIYGLLQIPLFIFASISGSSLLHDEESDGTIEFLYAQDVTRKDIYISKALVSLTNLLIVFFATVIVAMVMGSSLSADTFNAITIKNCFLFSLCGLLFFFSLGIFLSTILNKHKRPSKITTGIFLGTYLIGYLSVLIDNLSFLKIVSPMHLISPDTIAHSSLYGIGTGTFNILGPIIYLVLSVILIVIGGFLYEKKDLT